MEGVGRQVLGAADEVACGVVDQAVERAVPGPDGLDHGVDGSRVADVHRVGHDLGAVLVAQHLGGLVQHRQPAPAQVQLCPQPGQALGHDQAQPGAATGDQHALAGEKIVLEHGVSCLL